MIPNFVNTEFKKIIEDTLQTHGWTMPEDVANYITHILVEKLDKNPWQPQPSYAEAFLNTTSPTALIKLGDTCWFTRAVFPELMTHRGIGPNYWVEIGTTCYFRALKYTQDTTIIQMQKHFEFIAEMTYTALYHYGDFRNMWD